jgi:hypothetical protein
MEFKGFIGPSYQSRSPHESMEDLVNLFLERNESGNGKGDWVLYSTPGLSSWATVGSGPIRALWAGDGRLFCVSAAGYYGVFSSGASNLRGTVNNDGLPAQIFPNGNQVMIISGGLVYIDTGTALVQPTYTIAQGTVTVTAGGKVQNTWGDQFDPSLLGQTIMIGGSPYIVVAYYDAIHIRVASTFPAQGVGFTWNVGAVTGTCVVVANGAVQWFSGTKFDASMVDQAITINGVAWTVLTYKDPDNITAGGGFPALASNVAFSMVNGGFVNTNGTSVQRTSGDVFSRAYNGQTMKINGVNYVVNQVQSEELLTLQTSAGAQSNVPWSGSIVVTAVSGAFLDGYFIVATPSTRQINISALNNGLRWDPADMANKEGYPDNIAALMADHEELWILGTETIEVWRNTGNADFPLQRDAGAFIHQGCGARNSVVRLPGGIAWLAGDAKGGPVAVQAAGFQPKRVSTHAVEYRWRQYSQWADAQAFSYEEEGHYFWVISFPAGGETWVYDTTTSTWHRRGYDTSIARHRGMCHAEQWHKHLVGDYQTSTIWSMSSEFTDDGGTAIPRIRRSPYISTELKRQVHSAFRLECDYSAAHTVTLSYTNDGGNHWSAERPPDGLIIANGQPSRILGLRWNRLGQFIYRVYQITITGPAKVCVTAADIEGS